MRIPSTDHLRSASGGDEGNSVQPDIETMQATMCVGGPDRHSALMLDADCECNQLALAYLKADETEEPRFETLRDNSLDAVRSTNG